ncbi:MAG: transcriptional regulator [Phycisphaerae bacterium]|nr:transcriptional regulator [Phycisphaerae bacterium]
MALKMARLSALRKALLDARDLGKHRSMAELQAELGLSRRTVVRYLNDLRAQGDQVKMVRGKGWTMVKPRRDGTLESQIPEQLLVVLRKLGWALRGTPWHDEMEALFGAELKRVKSVARQGMHGGAMAEAVRLNKVLFIADFAPGMRAEGADEDPIEDDDEMDVFDDESSSTLRQSFDQLRERQLRQTAWDDVSATVWRGVLLAARESKPLVVEYLNASKRKLDQHQVVLPLGVVLRPGGAYMLVHKVGNLRDAEVEAGSASQWSESLRKRPVLRSFAMQRIRSVRVHEGSFKVPDGLSIRELVKASVGGFVQHGPLEAVELEYDALDLTLAVGEAWHSDQQVTVRGHGAGMTVRVRFRTNSRIEVQRRVQALGGKVRLIKPVAWRKEIARSARLLVEGHER